MSYDTKFKNLNFIKKKLKKIFKIKFDLKLQNYSFQKLFQYELNTINIYSKAKYHILSYSIGKTVCCIILQSNDITKFIGSNLS